MPKDIYDNVGNDDNTFSRNFLLDLGVRTRVIFSLSLKLVLGFGKIIVN